MSNFPFKPVANPEFLTDAEKSRPVILRALNRADSATVPIVAMTADAFADDVRKCLELGMNDHIAKPIDPELLFSKITAVLRLEK